MSSCRSTAWEETSEALADETGDLEGRGASALRGTVLEGSEALGVLTKGGGALRHLCWLDAGSALLALDRSDALDHTAALLLLKFEQECDISAGGVVVDRDVGGRVSVVAAAELPASAARITPAEGPCGRDIDHKTRHLRAFLQLQNDGGVMEVSVRGDAMDVTAAASSDVRCVLGTNVFHPSLGFNI